MLKTIRDIILPVECAVCGRSGESSSFSGVCDKCEKSIEVINSQGCAFCGRPVAEGNFSCPRCVGFKTFTDGIYTAAYYKESMREIIKAFKYKGKKHLGNYLGEVMLQLYRKELSYAGADVIVPMPMHRIKKRGRGYNQAEIIAGYLSKHTGIKKGKRYIIKIKNTPAQYSLTRLQRLENLKGSCRATKKAFGKAIVLVDDVATTGATIQNAAGELKKAGAERIYVLVAAHGK